MATHIFESSFLIGALIFDKKKNIYEMNFRETGRSNSMKIKRKKEIFI